MKEFFSETHEFTNKQLLFGVVAIVFVSGVMYYAGNKHGENKSKKRIDNLETLFNSNEVRISKVESKNN